MVRIVSGCKGMVCRFYVVMVIRKIVKIEFQCSYFKG